MGACARGGRLPPPAGSCCGAGSARWRCAGVDVGGTSGQAMPGSSRHAAAPAADSPAAAAAAAETLEKIRSKTREAMQRPEIQEKIKAAPRPLQHTEETKVRASAQAATSGWRRLAGCAAAGRGRSVMRRARQRPRASSSPLRGLATAGPPAAAPALPLQERIGRSVKAAVKASKVRGLQVPAASCLEAAAASCLQVPAARRPQPGARCQQAAAGPCCTAHRATCTPPPRHPGRARVPLGRPPAAPPAGCRRSSPARPAPPAGEQP
jgi:hypothetical protein